MKLRTALILASAYTLLSCTAAADADTVDKGTHEPCLICDNATVRDWGTIVNTDVGTYTCVGLIGAGKLGNIPAASCPAVRAQAYATCGCIEDVLPAEASQNNTQRTRDENQQEQPHPLPETETETELTADQPDIKPYRCDFCEPNEIMMYPNAYIDFAADVDTCAELQQLGANGSLIELRCNSIREEVRVACGCAVPTDDNVVVEQSPTTEIVTDQSSTTELQPHCGLCEGTMASPDAMLSVPFQGASSTSCGAILSADQARQILPSECDAILAALGAFDPCGCTDTTRPPVPVPVMLPESSSSPTTDPIEVSDTELQNSTEQTDAIDEASNATTISPTATASIAPTTAAPTASPSAMPSVSPSAMPSTVPTETPRMACPLCDDEHSVLLLDVTTQVQFFGNISCNTINLEAARGTRTSEECSALQQAVRSVCGCTTYSPTDQPSHVPSLSPTGAPSSNPSATPSNVSSTTPSNAPTASMSPSQIPSAVPTYIIKHEDCFSDLTELYNLERLVQDTTIPRVYTLCPNTVFPIGTVENSGVVIDGQSPLQLRPNVLYQCGEDGSRWNECIIEGGNFAVLSYYGVVDGIQEVVAKSYMKGLTFRSQRTMSAVLQAAGDVTFLDCVFADQANMVPVLIQWKGDGPSNQHPVSRSLQTTDSFSNADPNVIVGVEDTTGDNLYHNVTFRGCVFENNRVIKDLAFPGIIENTYHSSVVIENCFFENNAYGEGENPAPYGYAIRSFGPLTVKNTCFVNNEFRSIAPILSYTDTVHATMNHIFDGENHTSTLQCDLIAKFATDDQQQPECLAPDADVCAYQAVSTMAPTLSPTESERYDAEDGSQKSGAVRTQASTLRNTVSISLLCSVLWWISTFL